MNKYLGIAKLAGGEEEDEKGIKGSTILKGLGIAGAMHVAPNLAMKAIKSTERGNKALAGTFSAGVKHGRDGKKLHPNLRSALEYGVGPETLVDYNIGKRVGKGMNRYEGNPERQQVYLNRLRKKLGPEKMSEEMIKDVKKTPVLGSAYRHLQGEGSKKSEALLNRFTVSESAKKTGKQKAGDLAMLAGAGAVDPTLLMQPALAGSRKVIAKTTTGKRMMMSNFEKGLDGEVVPKWKERLIDTTVSPGILDTQRIGAFANRNIGKKNTDKVIREMETYQ